MYKDKERARVHNVHGAMIDRCTNPKNHAYARYGGRGIKVCEQWKSLPGFIASMGIPPKGMTLERIDTNGDYCPENCRWATHKEQNNNRRNNKIVVINGIAMTQMQAVELTGLKRQTLEYRLRKGLPLIQGKFKNDGSGNLR